MQAPQIFLQIITVNKRLKRVHEEGGDLYVELIARGEYRAEGQIVKISKIDRVAGLHLTQKIGREHKREKDIDRQNMNEVRQICVAAAL